MTVNVNIINNDALNLLRAMEAIHFIRLSPPLETLRQAEKMPAPEPEEKKAVRPPFQFGCMAGELWIADDFDAPLEEMREYME